MIGVDFAKRNHSSAMPYCLHTAEAMLVTASQSEDSIGACTNGKELLNGRVDTTGKSVIY